MSMDHRFFDCQLSPVSGALSASRADLMRTIFTPAFMGSAENRKVVTVLVASSRFPRVPRREKHFTFVEGFLISRALARSCKSYTPGFVGREEAGRKVPFRSLLVPEFPLNSLAFTGTIQTDQS